jgi:hypothetical protein
MIWASRFAGFTRSRRAICSITFTHFGCAPEVHIALMCSVVPLLSLSLPRASLAGIAASWLLYCIWYAGIKYLRLTNANNGFK